MPGGLNPQAQTAKSEARRVNRATARVGGLVASALLAFVFVRKDSNQQFMAPAARRIVTCRGYRPAIHQDFASSEGVVFRRPLQFAIAASC
jgi:hypothetical protein